MGVLGLIIGLGIIGAATSLLIWDDTREIRNHYYGVEDETLL